MDFQTLDLGRILQTANLLNAQKQQAQSDALRNKVLQTQVDQQQGIDQTLASNPNPQLSDLQKYGASGVNTAMQLLQARGAQTMQQYRQQLIAANTVANADDPVAAVQQIAPQFPQQYDAVHGQGSWAKLTPDQIKQQAKLVAQQAINGIIDPNKQYEAEQQMVLEHYKQGEANARTAAQVAAKERGQDIAAKTAAQRIQTTQPDALSVETTAQMIANGQMPMLTGFALKTPWGQSVVARVGQLKPDFNAATYGANASTLKAFSSGQQANTVRSLNVAISHLGTLSGLVDALGNGNVQALNTAANIWKTQTGSAAPTNFTSARDIVANEVVKAITASGGTLSDRQEAQAQIKAASSPAQLAGVVATWKKLLGGQLSGLRQQYTQGTGRNDFDRFLSPEVRTQLEVQPAGGQPAATGSGSVQIQSDADYSRLPSGTTFIAPDGSRRRKP